MRYEFVGKKIPYTGKTLWEILGNLKNFGVGRLVKQCYGEYKPELAFFKIVKVLPLPPPKAQFENRKVMVWIEEVFNDHKKPIAQIEATTEIAKFQLIPRIEEEEYLKKAEGLKLPVVNVKKYCFCPPLYKRLWEAENLSKEPMPRIKTVIGYDEYYEVKLLDEEVQPETCSLYKTDLTVDQMYQEIVRLKKIINANKDQPK